jgi:hypothetical protein
MGCDFDIQIQGFLQNKWIPIVFFEVCTRCGGFPLGQATRTAYKKIGIKGKYRSNDCVAFLYMHSLEHLGFSQATSPDDEKFWEKEIDSDWSDYYQNKYKWFVFYSVEQFKELIQCIQPIPDYYYPNQYVHETCCEVDGNGEKYLADERRDSNE